MIVFLLAGIFPCWSQSSEKPEALYLQNRPPLAEKTYLELPLGAIKPMGWLEDQLNRMKNGMTGKLDVLYEKVMGKRNGWLGGDGDVWERGPYWIDGLIPLAYILNDPALIEKTKPWVEWALASQQEDGYFGPSEDREPEPGLQRTNARDWWPKMVVLKFLQQYYNATNDKRVIKLMTNYFQYQLRELQKTPLGHWTHWGSDRGADNLMVVYWLYNITGEEFLLELGKIINEQTYPWKDIFLNKDHLSSLFSLHCVNLGQGLKAPVIFYQFNKQNDDLAAVKKAMADLKRTHGWPNGLFGGDEALHTGNPTQGSELCTAVEMMFSLEKMLEITGDIQWADHLERIAFNALPTQITDDFDARQYFQQLNQIRVSRNPRNFETPYHGTPNTFGLLTGYPCCTSNLHQGWPKFTQHLWMATNDGGIAALVYSPSRVNMKVSNGINIEFTEQTFYPFDEKMTFSLIIREKKVKEVNFPFHLRIPCWASKATIKVNGTLHSSFEKGGTIAIISRAWKTGDVVELELPMSISYEKWYEGSVAIERGPLLYALKIGEEWKKVVDDQKFGDRYGDWYYEVYPTSPWNYCLLEKNLKSLNDGKSFIVQKKSGMEGKYPWNPEYAPIMIKTMAKRMKDWKEYNHSAGPLPYSVQYQADLSPEEEIVLIPYGCTTLRITEFPVTRQ